MLNTAKQRSTVSAVAALARVTHTDHGNPRERLTRVSQAQLQAIKTGREASRRLFDLAKDLEAQVQTAENLVIVAVQEGRPVTEGLLDASVTKRTKYARISWKDATEKFAKALGLSFTKVNADLKAEVEPNNVEVDVLVLK
jgi:hypothetical protein